MSKISKPKWTKPWRFWFHYNKPMSRKMDMAVWTVHWKDKCYQVLNIQCNTDSETHDRNSQPHAIMRGKAHLLELRGPLPEGNALYSTAYIDRFTTLQTLKWHTIIEGGVSE
jgi:hypothetical protein